VISIKTKQLLAVRDAAKMLDVTPNRVVQLAAEGKLNPIVDSAGRRAFPIEQVESLVRERSQKAGR
jgi:hypothetical protein